LAAEEFMTQCGRDSYWGAAAAGGVLLLCVFGLVLITKAPAGTFGGLWLPLCGLLSLVVVSMLAVGFIRGGASADLSSGCAVALIGLALLGAGFVFFFNVCLGAVARSLSGPLH
jgi:hypothetical protein